MWCEDLAQHTSHDLTCSPVAGSVALHFSNTQNLAALCEESLPHHCDGCLVAVQGLWGGLCSRHPLPWNGPRLTRGNYPVPFRAVYPVCSCLCSAVVAFLFSPVFELLWNPAGAFPWHFHLPFPQSLHILTSESITCTVSAQESLLGHVRRFPQNHLPGTGLPPAVAISTESWVF